MTAPERSLAQRMSALQHANEIRIYRAELKRDLKAGRVSALTVLAAPDDNLSSMKVFALLLAVPKVGRVKANRWLGTMRVSPSKTVGGLSERQRSELLQMLRRYEARQRRAQEQRVLGCA